MAFPRLHWSVDGAGYPWSKATTTRGTAFSADTLKKIDGSTIEADSVSSTDGFIIQLAGSVNVDKIGVRISCVGGPSTAPLQYSTNSTNGIDGTWATLTTIDVPKDAPILYTEYAVTQAVCSWLRLCPMQGQQSSLYNFSIFGDVQSPAYEFWNEAGANKLNTADYPLAFAPAGNNADSHQELKFKIKNTSGFTHNYAVTVNGYRYGGDPTITNGFTLSLDAGSTKLATVNVNGVTAGSFSGVISLFMDLLAADNPGDGYHYFAIDVVQS